MGENEQACRGVLPPERVDLGMAAATVAAAAALVVAVALSGTGLLASASTVLLAAGAPRAYALASGGRLQRGVGPLVMLLVAGGLAIVASAVFVDAWHAYDLLGEELIGRGRGQFLAWALTSRAVLGDYVGSAWLAGAGLVLGAATAVPLIRATLASVAAVPGVPGGVTGRESRPCG